MGFGPDALAVIMTIMILIVMAYTILGGMFSILVTDFMQFVILTFGMLVATVAVLVQVDLQDMSAAVSTVMAPRGGPVHESAFRLDVCVWIFISSIAAAALWQPGTATALASESLLSRNVSSSGPV